MPDYISYDVPASHVINEYQSQFHPTPPLVGSWTPGQVGHGGSVPLLRVVANRAIMTPAQWGRTGERFTDDSSPSLVRRGLVAATAFEQWTETEARDWENKRLRASVRGRRFFWMGCSWEEDAFGNARFAVLTNPTYDLSAKFHREPVIVQPAKTKAWIDPHSEGVSSCSAPPGTFCFVEV
ncbi:MAG TPA: hypothetical protein VHZ26_11435 [Caulobacteraceae bacterium]|jgi:hypothetical protein|nr:hypothetical protein [Caulobacteraceae bacterium]